MNTSVEYVNLDWLLDSDASSATITKTQQDVERAEIPIPQSVGNGTYEAWMLSIGTVIYRANYNFNPEVSGQVIPTANVTASFNEH
jgi:hypothetical protein